MEEVLENIKQEPSVEFVCCLPSFDQTKTLGGKSINIKTEIEEINSEETKDQDPNCACEICHKSFRHLLNLNRHMRTHNKVQCQVCHRMVTKLNYEKHLKTHENEKERKFQCKLCQQKFLSHGSLELHERIHKQEWFSCDLCGYSCVAKFSLKTHLNSHVQEGKYKCVKCRQLFEAQSKLKIHMEKRRTNPRICERIKRYLRYHSKIHNNASFECDLCGRKLTCKQSMKKHMLIHLNLYPHRCHKCGKVFREISNLKCHMASGHKKKSKKECDHTVECPICRGILGQNVIKTHLKRHNVKEGEKNFKCSECPKMFWTKQEYRSHERTHNKFKCDQCGTKIAQKNIFAEHLMTHFNPQKFGCKACEKTFNTRTKLKQHITHCHPSGSKKLECEICQKVLKSSAHLSSHKKVHGPRKTCPICLKSLSALSYPGHFRLHGDEKKSPEHECKICSKKFINKRYLRVHSKIHNNAKFECDLCGKFSTCKQSMKKHMLIHLNLYPHRCHNCGKIFRQIHHLRRHMSSVHMKDSGKKSK